MPPPHLVLAYSAKGPRNKSLIFIFPNKFVITKSSKVSKWLSKFVKEHIVFITFFHTLITHTTKKLTTNSPHKNSLSRPGP